MEPIEFHRLVCGECRHRAPLISNQYLAVIMAQRDSFFFFKLEEEKWRLNIQWMMKRVFVNQILFLKELYSIWFEMIRTVMRW